MANQKMKGTIFKISNMIKLGLSLILISVTIMKAIIWKTVLFITWVEIDWILQGSICHPFLIVTLLPLMGLEPELTVYHSIMANSIREITCFNSKNQNQSLNNRFKNLSILTKTKISSLAKC